MDAGKRQIKVDVYSNAILAGLDWNVPVEHMVNRLEFLVTKTNNGRRVSKMNLLDVVDKY